MVLRHACMVAIAAFVDVDSLRELQQSCVSCWKTLQDDAVWRCAALAMRGDAFWDQARRRPAVSSRPLGSWRAEVLRLHHFDKLCRCKLGHAMDNASLYLLWEVMDVPSHDRHAITGEVLSCTPSK